MNSKRNVEIFSAGCPVCQSSVDLVNRLACDLCTVSILGMHDINVAKRARELGVRSVPAVAINGHLAACCTGGGIEEQALRAAGLGRA